MYIATTSAEGEASFPICLYFRMRASQTVHPDEGITLGLNLWFFERDHCTRAAITTSIVVLFQGSLSSFTKKARQIVYAYEFSLVALKVDNMIAMSSSASYDHM